MGRLKGAGRGATAHEEQEFLRRAEVLREDPRKILANFETCGKSCFLCPFPGLDRKLRKVQAVADDAAALDSAARHAHPLASAYAATLLLVAPEKRPGNDEEEDSAAAAGRRQVPRLVRARTPFGDAAIAIRGNVPAGKLAGVQHYDDPRLRLLNVLDVVRSRGLHIYSTREEMMCTGRKAEPPREFLKFIAGRFKVPLEEDDGLFRCAHLNRDDVQNPRMVARPFLHIRWQSAGVEYAICRRCAKSTGNSLGVILTHIAVPKPRGDFTVGVRGGMTCHHDCTPCHVRDETPVDEDLEGYLVGKMPDEDLIRRHVDRLLRSLPQVEPQVFITGDHCYGIDRKGFAAALHPTDEEGPALRWLLKQVPTTVVTEGESAGRLLQDSWDEHGEGMVDAVVKDRAIARDLYAKGKGSHPTQVLREALVRQRQRDVLSKLPRYERLPEVARFADRVARGFKTGGASDAVREVERLQTDNTAVKSVAYSFLLAMGESAAKKWHYTLTEQEFAEYLKDRSRALMDAEPSRYHECLQAVLHASGSTETIPDPSTS